MVSSPKFAKYQFKRPLGAIKYPLVSGPVVMRSALISAKASIGGAEGCGGGGGLLRAKALEWITEPKANH